MGLIETIRKWIDGTEGSDPLSGIDEQAHPRRVWEEFFVKIAREIEVVMQREMFTPPGGQTFIPREYIVYLSNEDDKDWQGEKRRGLEQGLHHILTERARELSGATKLATRSFAVELRVDGTLQKGEFRVQAVWDATEGSHTMVTSRPQETQMPNLSSSLPATAPLPNLSPLATTELQTLDEAENEVTRVSTRLKPLYSVEVWRGGVRLTAVPVFKQEATVGRGSRSTTVDVQLPGDPEVSRVHALLQKQADGQYWLISKGRNPSLVEGREVPREQPVQVHPDQRIEICSFTLRIQP